MSDKKYFQAKRLSKNPFAGKDTPKSQNHKWLTWAVLGGIFILMFSGGISYIYHVMNGYKQENINKMVTVDKPRKRAVRHISDEDFRQAKEYNFYTQLEGRTMLSGDVSNSILDSSHNSPFILELESLSSVMATGTAAPYEQKAQTSKNTVLDSQPLVLESTLNATKNKQDKPVTDRVVRLQLGSFKHEKEAAIHQNKLKKYGFNSNISRGKNGDQETVYRVQSGPFSMKEVSTVKERLSSLGISYFEVR